MVRETLLDQCQTLQMAAAVERQYSLKSLKIWVQAMILSLIICITKKSYSSSFEPSFLVFKTRGLKQVFCKVLSSFEKLVIFKLFIFKYIQGKLTWETFSPYDPYELYLLPWGRAGNWIEVRESAVLELSYSIQLSCFNFIGIINPLLIFFQF